MGVRLFVGAVFAFLAWSGWAERIRLDAGWRFSCDPVGTRAFAHDAVAAWLDAWTDSNGETSDLPPTPRQAQVSCNDAGWRSVRVPHDYALDNGFGYDRPSQQGCVAPAREGWYRLELDIPASARGKRVFFECDGAMSFAMVWINGRFVGGWPYGYTPWRVELTPHVAFGGANVLAVRTAYAEDSSRFYVGAGLYRDCHLVFCDDDHLVPGSVFITTPSVTKDEAVVRVAYEMSRSGRRERVFTVPEPRLWDVDDPHLYSVDVEGESFRYGIRTCGFYPDSRGFQLNGRRVPIRGVCLHQDLDVLGNVWNRSAWKRRLLKLKDVGVNAVRMSHYRHPAGVYDLCDELGLLVMDEVFDQWNRAFNPHDYHELFPKWHERDLRACVRADRNHPSIVLWGVGNEIVEQRMDLGGFDPELYRRTGEKLMKVMREEDPTRMVTTANNNPDIGFATSDAPDFVDVYGFNYRPSLFAPYRRAHPAKPIISTETGCYIATRGEYFFPVEKSWDYWDLHSTSYLMKRICSMEEEWSAHDAEPSHAGGFYWTGFDYLGGPAGTPGARRRPNSLDPAAAARMKAEIDMYGMVKGSLRACPTGLFDLAGFPRDVCAQFLARWRPDEPMVHLLPHWNWPERIGRKTPVMAFTSGDEVELFLNGVSQGRRRPDFPGARCRWDEVVYRPGELRAVAFRGGVKWCEQVVATTGEPAELVFEAEAATPLVQDGESVSYLNLSVLDKKGRLVPRTRLPVRIAVSESLELVGVENGDEADLAPFRASDHVAFNGRLSVVVRPKIGAKGPFVVTAAADGLPACVWNFPL